MCSGLYGSLNFIRYNIEIPIPFAIIMLLLFIIHLPHSFFRFVSLCVFALKFCTSYFLFNVVISYSYIFS